MKRKSRIIVSIVVASVFMLAAIIWLYNKSGTFDIPLLLDMLAKNRLDISGAENLLFLAFFLAFAFGGVAGASFR